MNHLTLIAPKETQVIAACKEAAQQGQDYALKALIAGQLLIEHRETMIGSHGENRFLHGGKARPEADQFCTWIAKQLPEVSQPTAYRWMQAAERVCRAQLGIAMHKDYAPVLEIEGGTMSLSQALTLPESKLGGPARAFRQGIFDFMADHTLGEAARAVFDDQGDAKRITLAANGKVKGGTRGEDRKAFEKFVAEKLKHITSAVMVAQQVKGSSARKLKERTLAPNQRAAIMTAFTDALRKWPRWLVDSVLDSAKAEAKLSDPERSTRRNS